MALTVREMWPCCPQKVAVCKIINKDKNYVFICINENEIKDLETGNIGYEYDYNEFAKNLTDNEISDISKHPGKYISYQVPKEPVSPTDIKTYVDQRINELAKNLAATQETMLEV